MAPFRRGLYGGTFDPLHLGHLRIAEEIREEFNLDVIDFIPTNIPPHKTDRTVSSGEIRAMMVSNTVRYHPNFDISLIELSKPGPSYTIDTLRDYYGNHQDDEMFFIMGMDSFHDLPTWEQYMDFFSLSNFIVCSRPGYKGPCFSMKHIKDLDFFKEFKSENAYVHQHRSGNFLYFYESSIFNISSTNIRSRVKEGKSIRYLVTTNVYNMISFFGLYKEDVAWERKE